MYGPEFDFDPESEEYEGMQDAPSFEIAFAADKEEISKALGGMIAAIAAESGKNFHDVTDEEIRHQGALLLMYEAEEYWKHVPKEEREREQWEQEQWGEGRSYPTAEPGDWISEEGQGVDVVLTGEPMIRRLRQGGAWPRDWGPDKERNRRELLIKVLRQQNPQATAEQAVQRVDELSPGQLEDYYYQARRQQLV
jgi:hypothetical protein